MTRQSEDKLTILYARLSRDDVNEQMGESNSIANQRLILERYAKDKGFENTLVLVDDGFSGTNFERPSFVEMMKLVDEKKVSSIIVKDHSRLGRNYLVIGTLMDSFISKGIRYIAINDNIDSSKGIDDLLPMRDLFNEFYARDTSKKIRAIWQAKGKTGERLAVVPPYGYRKDPNNNKQLIIDEESANVVKRIFTMYVEGKNAQTIANIINSERILIPSAYKYEKSIVSKPRKCKDPYFWCATTIHKLLDAIEYVGHTVNFKTYSHSYKDNRPHLNSPDKQMLFENTHPAIIDEDTWDIVRKMREHKRRYTSYGTQGLFSGTLFCADCGEKLYFNISKTKSKLVNQYMCSEYKKQLRTCTAHYIREETLIQLVLTDMRKLLGFVRKYEKQFVKLVMDSSITEQKRDIVDKKKALDKHLKRISEIDTLFERLYEDNVIGKVSDERYEKISLKFETEQAELKAKVSDIEKELFSLEEETVNIDKFLCIVRKYTEVEELTPAIIHEFIDKIIIHEPEKARGNRVQRVDIIYNNIGIFNLNGLE